ncbi:SH3 domain-containing protein [Lipomyces oligophaga]|uniref:SH3 domain-containing protein n=1 Tax=Lipomyces oligophaga TaxID=45792 RepID=UPI0034CE9207
MADVALYNRSLTNIFNELDFLKSSNVITPALFDHFRSLLPASYSPGMTPADIANNTTMNSSSEKSSSFSTPAPAQIAPPTYAAAPMEPQPAEAMYDYHPTDQSDLPLYRGAQIVVLEKINPDWWRGRDLSTGREGVFPSSYVRVRDGYSGPPQQQQQQYGQPAPYQAPAPVAYQAPNSQPVAQGSNQQLGEEHKHHNFEHLESSLGKNGKKFGKKLGNAAIFGAGATIGSNIVNSIF